MSDRATPKQPGTWTRLEMEDRQALERLAELHDRSLSAEVRVAVKFYLAAHNADGTAKSS